MANVATISGTAQVIANLKTRWKSMGDRTAVALKTAGLQLQRESQRLVPVDFGVLKNSAYTRASGSGFRTVVNVGFTAAYAIYIHENVAMKGRGMPRRAPSKGRYWDPQGKAQAKFLEEPARRMAPQLKKTIQKIVRFPI